MYTLSLPVALPAVASAFLEPARTAMLPDIVKPEELDRLTSNPAARLGGRP